MHQPLPTFTWETNIWLHPYRALYSPYSIRLLNFCWPILATLYTNLFPVYFVEPPPKFIVDLNLLTNIVLIGCSHLNRRAVETTYYDTLYRWRGYTNLLKNKSLHKYIILTTSSTQSSTLWINFLFIHVSYSLLYILFYFLTIWV